MVNAAEEVGQLAVFLGGGVEPSDDGAEAYGVKVVVKLINSTLEEGVSLAGVGVLRGGSFG